MFWQFDGNSSNTLKTVKYLPNVINKHLGLKVGTQNVLPVIYVHQ